MEWVGLGCWVLSLGEKDQQVTHTHTNREQHPDTDTHTRQELGLSRGEITRLARWVLCARAAGAAVRLGWVSKQYKHTALRIMVGGGLSWAKRSGVCVEAASPSRRHFGGWGPTCPTPAAHLTYTPQT